ncbi:MAG TPA: cofactor-independent phosphoglycerate mutase [Dehalococcoidales bacterium]|nr:cofactor-independent phosphoglycerate mutase [Dehalococcoidales bacterium]
MKYCVVIIDGAAGLPLPERGGKTCLELAETPNLDALAGEGEVGLARTVPAGMEPSSACACMSVLGYDPKVYYRGRSAIEAKAMDIPVGEGEVVFRCNLVGVIDGRMRSYSAGHITTEESRELVTALNDSLGDDSIQFYPGVSYRHILKLREHEEALEADCTPPHDIPDKPVNAYLPKGEGSEILRDLMQRSEKVLQGHPINVNRAARGDVPATTIWLFWGSGKIPAMPSFKDAYGLNAALTSGVDLLKGLGKMAGMKVLEIAGVSDGPDNDYAAQVEGALKALGDNDLVIIHIEAPDEAAHAGSINDKVGAIEKIDSEVISRLRSYEGDDLRVLAMPDHPTPIEIRTHSPEPVPFLLWGKGFSSNGAKGYSEAAAKGTGLLVSDGYKIMGKLVKG